MSKAFRVCGGILAVIQSKWNSFYFFPVIYIWNHKINVDIYKHMMYTYMHVIYICAYIHIYTDIYYRTLNMHIKCRSLYNVLCKVWPMDWLPVLKLLVTGLKWDKVLEPKNKSDIEWSTIFSWADFFFNRKTFLMKKAVTWFTYWHKLLILLGTGILSSTEI